MSQETLLIVHLSSVDSYVDYYGVNPAIALITAIKTAIITHAGPVVIMDQGWDEISEDAKILRTSVLELQQYHDGITLFHHDEMCDVSPWQDGMTQLTQVLRELKAARVRLGGFWTSENHFGCVHETQKQLRTRGITCYLDKKICALDENDPYAQQEVSGKSS